MHAQFKSLKLTCLLVHPPMKEEDPVEDVVVEEAIVEVPSMKPHVTPAETSVAPTAGFHFMQESELEA